MFVQAGHATRFYACANLACTREWLIQPGDPYVRTVYPPGTVTYRHTDHASSAAVYDGRGGWFITGTLTDESQPTDAALMEADRFAATHPDECVHPDNVFWTEKETP